MAEKPVDHVLLPSGFSTYSAPPRFFSRRPTDQEVRKHIIPLLSTGWVSLCFFLGLEDNDTKKAKMNNPGDIEGAMFECIKKWLNGSTKNPVTWEFLLKALEEGAELKEQAKDLKKTLSLEKESVDSECIQPSTLFTPISQQVSMAEVPLMGVDRFALQSSSQIMELQIEGIHDLQKILSTSANTPIVLEKRLMDKFLTLYGKIESCLLHLPRPVLMLVSRIVLMFCRGLQMKHVPGLSPFGPDNFQAYIAMRSDFLDIRLLKQIVDILNEKEVTEAFQQYQEHLGQELSRFVVYCKKKGISNIAPLSDTQDTNQSSSQSDGLILRVSVKVQEFYLSYILKLKDFFQDELGIHLQFKGISVGCLILHFIFSRCLIHELYVFLPSHLPTLKRFNITALCVPDYFVIDVDKGEFVVLEELNEEKAKLKTQQLQNEVLSLKFKLKDGERLRKKVEGDKAELTGELLKIRSEKEELVLEKKELQAKKQTLLAENEELVDENKELQAEKQTLLAEKEELVLEKKELQAEKQTLSAEKQELVDEKAELVTEKKELVATVKRQEEYIYRSLQLEATLNSQSPRSASSGQVEHDETPFIIVHQVFELWLKLSRHELDFIITTLCKTSTEEELHLVVERLQRLKEVWKVQVSHFPIIGTLTPMDFMSFRDHLHLACGFDSAQFRMIETQFGVMEEKRSMLCPVPGFIDKMEEKEREELLRMRYDQENNLFKALESWLARTPGLKKMPEEMFQKLPSRERWVDEHRMSHEAMMGAIVIHQCRFEPRFQMPYQILLLIKDLDGLFNKWRYHHMLMVHRTIGDLQGTAGTQSGYRYLESTLSEDYRIFSDLNGLAAYVHATRSAEVPALSEELKEELHSSFGEW